MEAAVSYQRRNYKRLWMRDFKRRRRAAAIAHLGGNCRWCGRTDELEFDHIHRETKTVRIADVLTCRWELLRAELAKCQLLCTDCHEFKTQNEEDLDKVPF